MPKAQSEVESRQSDIARSHITETSVRILHTAEEIESIRGFWSACSGERDSDIDILLALVRGDQARQRPHVLVVEEDGKPTALGGEGYPETACVSDWLFQYLQIARERDDIPLRKFEGGGFVAHL